MLVASPYQVGGGMSLFDVDWSLVPPQSLVVIISSLASTKNGQKKLLVSG